MSSRRRGALFIFVSRKIFSPLKFSKVMNILAPVRTIMTSKLFTVSPTDKLIKVREIFDTHAIHHIPVVRFKEIIGIVSKTDLLYFMRGYHLNDEDRFVNEARLRAFTAEEIMTKGMAKISPNDRISVAIEIFLANRFHAVPVVENEELVGIVTTFDVMKALASEVVTPDQVLNSQQS